MFVNLRAVIYHIVRVQLLLFLLELLPQPLLSHYVLFLPEVKDTLIFILLIHVWRWPVDFI